MHTETDGEVDIIADGELLAKVWAKGDSTEIAKSLDKWIDRKMGTAEASIAVELEDAHSNGKGWKIRSTRNKSLTCESSR